MEKVNGVSNYVSTENLKRGPDDVRIGGLEGGATHSTFFVVDGRGKKLSEVRGPHTNHWVLGIEGTAARINDMLVRSKQELEIPESVPYDIVGLNLSGCEEQKSNKLLADTLHRLYPDAACRYVVGSDTLGSLKTGVQNGGVVLISGTGSNCLLIDNDGKSYGCGGWGHMLGDEGSAYWLAHRACKYVFDDLDGLSKAPNPISYVWPAMQQYFEVKDQQSMLPHLYADFNKCKFASFTKELAIGCERQDALCLELFYQAGLQLARFVNSVARKASSDMKLEKGGLKVICVGSVWKSWCYLKPGFLKEIHDRCVVDELTLMRLTVSAALGSCYIAADKINCSSMNKTYKDNVEEFFHYKRDNMPPTSASNGLSAYKLAAGYNNGVDQCSQIR